MISSERINAYSPYKVTATSPACVQFATQGGALYEVGFTPDYSMGIDGVYQFYVLKLNHISQPQDNNIRCTIWAVIEDFFHNNEYAMLYICDTSDGKQALRNRLFQTWFVGYANKEEYTFLSKEATYMEETFYAAVIIKKTNPRYKQFLERFNDFAEEIDEKLQ